MKMLKIASLAFLLCNLSYGNEGLDKLNSLRERAGMPLLVENSTLSEASANHSKYMQTNRLYSHYEDRDDDDYTGDTAANRTEYVSYASAFVGENILHAMKNGTTAIEALMAGIYHRFNFLSFEWDEVGSGVSEDGTYFTYNMGNQGVNALCEDSPYTDGDYYTPCADSTIKVPVDDYDNAVDAPKAEAIDIVLYPPKDGDMNYPAFYEELPDPLPDHRVSGFPISASFNPSIFTSAPTVDDFLVIDAEGNRLEDIAIMDKDNDPNHLFNGYEHAVFPKYRLAWGTRYDAEIHYTYEDESYTKRWCFSTKTLGLVAQKVYTFNSDKNVTILSGEPYALYVKPRDENDTIGSISYEYNTDNTSIGWLDNNTLLIRAEGESGDYLEIEIVDGYTLRLTVEDEDTAVAPETQTCGDYDGDGVPNEDDLDDDGDHYLDADELAAGSNPYDNRDTPKDFDKDYISDVTDTDDDNDGLSDKVEIANGLNPLNTHDAGADNDNDGFSNAIEIGAGTDMRDSESFPIWTPIVSGDGIMFFVPSM